MTQTTKGYLVGLAALGVMLTQMAGEVGKIAAWDQITTPAFIAQSMLHLGTVIGAFVGGRLIPTKE